MKYWFIYMDFEKFDIHIFHVYLKFSLKMLFFCECPQHRKTLIRRGFILKVNRKYSLKILNIFITLALKHISFKTKTFLRKME